MTKVTDFFTALMRKYLPDPFVFAIVLTLLTLVLAITVEGTGFLTVTDAWGDGFWGLLAFTAQMAVILAAGYVVASAPLTDRGLNWICDKVSTPRAAVVVATLVGSVGSYLNWGFGLVIGGIVAKKLAYRIRGVHYPMIIAAAYSGFTFYGLGLSATIPLTIATPGHTLENQIGVIPLADTIFHPVILITALVTIIVLPIVNMFLHPRPGQPVTEIDREEFRGEMEPDRPLQTPVSGAGQPVGDGHGARSATTERATATPVTAVEEDDSNTIASRLNNSRVLGLLIAAFGFVYIVRFLIRGESVDLDFVNFVLLFLGILLLGSPANYVAKLSEGIKTVTGIILQFPFYAGILAIMTASGLVLTISDFFVGFSSAQTLPFWGYISSFVINFFAPSGGGHWVLQGPFMMSAAAEVGADPAATAVSVQLGNAWNDLIQPFWILPALALSRLKLKDIMGYTVIDMVVVGVIYGVAILIWGQIA